jgi:TIR domain
MPDIPLKVLIIDSSDSSANVLGQALKNMPQLVLSVNRISSLDEAKSILNADEINTIFIDPLAFDLESATRFIFNIRKQYPSTVFVLYLDFALMEGMRSEFYSGARKRLTHYFKLNKLTPASTFAEELRAIIRNCQNDLYLTLTQDKIKKLQEELQSIQTRTPTELVNIPMKLLQDIQDQLTSLKAGPPKRTTNVKPNSVFLSYRFAESEYVEGLTALLKNAGFSVITGQNANTFISQAILERIRSCEFFICLMTRADEKKDGSFTTSPWLLEEKGAALAMDKRIVLMVEDGVSDIGGLQGDWQRINFSPKSFTIASIRAVEQLKSYSGLPQAGDA